MRIILLIGFLLLSTMIFCQEIDTIKEINDLIRFKPIDDTVHGIFYSYDTLKDNSSVNQKIIVVVSKELSATNTHGQIFILQRENGKLKIIDSTKGYEKDGRGPHAYFLNDTLQLIHNYHQGGFSFYYVFNSYTKKYDLIRIEMSNVLHENKELNNDPTGVEVRSFDVIQQKLTINKLDDWDGKIIKSKTIKRTLPKAIIPDLVHYIDPVSDNYEIDKLYDKIFN